MNANQIINESMSLEEKLFAIDLAMVNAEAKHKASNVDVPFDPALATICDGCE